MNNKLYIGIDPGKNGFITIRNPNTKTFTFYNIPKLSNTVVNLHSLNTTFNKIVSNAKKNNSTMFCVLEDVHAIYGSSAKSTFEFGKIVGILEGFLVAYTIPYAKISPKVWQNKMWKGITKVKKTNGRVDTKKTSILAAQTMYPNIDFRRTEKCSKIDDNKVDSLLICEYARINNL